MWSQLKHAQAIRLDVSQSLGAVYDILKILGLRTGFKTRLSRFRSGVQDHGVTDVRPGGQLTDGVWTAKETQASVPMVDWEHAQKLVCFVLRRNRMTQDHVRELLQLFHIEPTLMESAVVSMPEKDSLRVIARCLPFVSHEQFAVGPYHLDLYCPEIRLAVECNEGRHQQYDQQDENARRNFIRQQLRCHIVDYDPLVERFSPLDVVREIVALLVTPRFLHWQEMVQRGPWPVSVSPAVESDPTSPEQSPS